MSTATPQTGGDSDSRLRAPRPGTLSDLYRRYQAFLGRVGDDGFTPVPPLTQYAVVGYRRATDPPPPLVAAFEVWKPVSQLADLKSGETKSRPFDPVRSAVTVAAMLRNAAARAAEGSWPRPRIATFIHGHGPDGGPATGTDADRRFAFLPLPTINPLRVESIRRVLVVAPPGDRAAFTWAQQALSGQQLFDEKSGDPVATLSMLSTSDEFLQRNYLAASEVWSTVTPVVMPGRYINGPGRVMRLFRSAFAQAGFPPELHHHAQVEWRDVGFRPGLDLARNYRVPCEMEKMARLHVRIRWPVPVRGPLALGLLRYRGLGVFAAERA